MCPPSQINLYLRLFTNYPSGDSYTTTSFNPNETQPSRENPLGNPPYPGHNSANGPNWIDYLTVKYNKTNLLTYNLAVGGATIDSALVTPIYPNVPSIADQIQHIWFPKYASSPEYAPWVANDTLFAVFDGINDVINSFTLGVEATSVLYKNVFAVYHGLIDQLYYAGARNFLLVDIPPVDRAPWTTIQGSGAQLVERAAILAWNELLASMALEVKGEKADANIFTVSACNLFNQVLDNPSSYFATAQYLETTRFCEAYQ